MNKQEENRDYNEIILQIDHGTFTLLVFSVHGSMGRECQKLYSHVAHPRRDILEEIPFTVDLN